MLSNVLLTLVEFYLFQLRKHSKPPGMSIINIIKGLDLSQNCVSGTMGIFVLLQIAFFNNLFQNQLIDTQIHSIGDDIN